MDNSGMSIINKNSLDFVKDFFDNLDVDNKSYLPNILKEPGRWMAASYNNVIALYFLNKKELERVVEYQNKKLNPFPGFIIAESQRKDFPIAIQVSGACNYYASNRTSNIIAFSVSPGATFTVVDHYHDIKDKSGNLFKYHVDLALIIGVNQDENWSSVKSKLEKLLNNTLIAWQNAI